MKIFLHAKELRVLIIKTRIYFKEIGSFSSFRKMTNVLVLLTQCAVFVHGSVRVRSCSYAGQAGDQMSANTREHNSKIT